MKFDDIMSNWEVDSQIDQTDLGNEAIKIPKFHHKYYMMYVEEKASLRRLEASMKILKLEKHEFYTQGPTEETRQKGWKLPPRGLILKADVPLYMDSDKEIIEMSLKIGVQQEKVDFLKSIIDSLKTRAFIIRDAIDFLKFTMGG